jgi:hypothetical protein
VVAKGCAGSQNEAEAQVGHLCIFNAQAPGAIESEWHGATFKRVEEPDAILSTVSGKQGIRIVFQTTGFSEGGQGTVPAGGAFLSAGGPWAVRSP